MDPIQAGLNWYTYCGNNPIKFIDPLGLFAWNEDDDHIFDLQYEVEKEGGTFSWNENTGIATVSIYGVEVTFQIGQDGINMQGQGARRHRKMTVTAAAFYSTVVGAAEEMMFLTGHKAFGGWAFGALHMTTFMFVSEDSDYYNHEDFKDNIKWGNVRYATFGGTSINGKVGGSLIPGQTGNSTQKYTRCSIFILGVAR